MNNGKLKNKPASDRRIRYIVITVILSVLSSQTAYQGGRIVTRMLPHTDMTSALDAHIPFLPWTVMIYFGTFAFWILGYYLIFRLDRPEADRFFCAQHITFMVTLLIFLFFPTTNIRPEVTGNTIWDGMMRFLYRTDEPDGLFPSLHCVVSWLCWVGIRRDKKLPSAYRLLILLAAAAICVSTLTTKQHVIADAAGGILLSELAYIIAGSERVRGVYTRFIDRLLKTDSAG